MASAGTSSAAACRMARTAGRSARVLLLERFDLHAPGLQHLVSWHGYSRPTPSAAPRTGHGESGTIRGSSHGESGTMYPGRLQPTQVAVPAHGGSKHGRGVLNASPHPIDDGRRLLLGSAVLGPSLVVRCQRPLR